MDFHSRLELASHISYDPESGDFTWIKDSGQRGRVGRKAGCIRVGYRSVTVNGKRYLCHRLAWAFVHGDMSENVIDHIDGNPLNNRISNLRDVPVSVNNQNRNRVNRNSKIGLQGVSKWGNGYAAKLTRYGKVMRIGVYQTPELAHQAYLSAKREHDANTFHR